MYLIWQYKKTIYLLLIKFQLRENTGYSKIEGKLILMQNTKLPLVYSILFMLTLGFETPKGKFVFQLSLIPIGGFNFFSLYFCPITTKIIE